MNRLFALGLCLSLSLVGCDSASGPRSGEVVFELNAPEAPVGALSFAIQTPAEVRIEEVTSAATGSQLFVRPVRENEVRGIILSPVRGAHLLRVSVSDVRRPADVQATILEVSSPDFALQTPAAYTLDRVR